MAFDLATAAPVEEMPAKRKFDLASAKPVTAPELLDEPDGKAPKRSLAEEVRRQVGLTARAAGPVAGGALLGAGVGSVVPVVGTALGATAGAAAGGITQILDKFLGGNRIDALMDRMGVPQPENATERIVSDAAGAISGGAGVIKGGELMAKAATPLARRVGEVLASRPGMQTVSAASSGGAAGAVREEGGGPVAQLVAGVAGGAVPAVPALAAAATRAALRGGEAGRQRVAQNIQTFEDAGAGSPTVGQATESRGNRAVESLLSKTPGSAGRVAAKAEAEAVGLGNKVDEMATNLSGSTGAAPAGRRIKGGLEKFVDDFKGTSGKLYDELDRHIPKDSSVGVTSTRAALEKLNADIPGAPELSKWFKNAKIQGIEGALDKDAPATQAQPIISQILGAEGQPLVTGQTAAKAAGIPYEALKKLRTLVGNEISDSTIASDVPRSKWKPLYAALSKDMAAAAQVAGPKAEAAFVRANNHYSAGMKRLDDVLGPIMKKGDPEDVFKAALSGTQEGATTINGVMKSLPTESRKAVAATMLQRLGKATPGKQNDLGEVFSTESFLTNWNKLHPDSKRVLFSTLPDDMRSDLDKIAKVAANAREGSKVFANPSGSGQVVAATSGLTAFGVLLATGQFAGAAAIAGGAALANAQSRLMTSPGFVKWLAKSTKAPAEQLPAQLNQLFQQSLYMKGDERKDAREFVKTARAAAATQRSQPTQ